MMLTRVFWKACGFREPYIGSLHCIYLHNELIEEHFDTFSRSQVQCLNERRGEASSSIVTSGYSTLCMQFFKRDAHGPSRAWLEFMGSREQPFPIYHPTSTSIQPVQHTRQSPQSHRSSHRESSGRHRRQHQGWRTTFERPRQPRPGLILLANKTYKRFLRINSPILRCTPRQHRHYERREFGRGR
jgi:hypothetical protein